MTQNIASAAANNPIGVFDSGVGGLSVLRALQTEMPNEHFVYVADSGHAPYGERDDAHVIARAHAITKHLLAQQHINALVVACNTATAAAIHLLREAYPDLPIVGIEPALKPAATLSKTGVIGVMATRGTLQSEKFGKLLQSLHGQATFVLQPCDGLADAIEHDDAMKIEAYCAQYTGAMGRFGTKAGDMDTLVLGCTHYPFVTDELRHCTGDKVFFLEGGAPVARQARRLIEGVKEVVGAGQPTHPDVATPSNPTTRFFTTGSAEVLRDSVARWLSVEAAVTEIDIQ